jgi:hypothetical protein
VEEVGHRVDALVEEVVADIGGARTDQRPRHEYAVAAVARCRGERAKGPYEVEPTPPLLSMG